MKLTGEQAKTAVLLQEVLALDTLPDLLEDAIKAYLLDLMGLTTPPEWYVESRNADLERRLTSKGE